MQVLTKNPHFAHDPGRHGEAISLVPIEEMSAQAPFHVALGGRKVVHGDCGEPIVNGIDEVETRAAAVETNTVDRKPG